MLRRKASVLVALLALLGGAACRKKPQVNVTVIPRYPCAGEDVTFSYSLKNLSRIEVKNRQGVVLHSNSSRSGSFVIHDINADMLPLTATGWQGNKSGSKILGPRPEHDVFFAVVTDDTNTEVFRLRSKVLYRVEKSQIGVTQCDCIYRGTEEAQCNETAPIYEITNIYVGQADNLSSAWFAERARVVGVYNPSDFFALTYKQAGTPIASLAPGRSQTVNFADDIKPAGEWLGEYAADNYHAVWQGIGVEGKTCGGWVTKGLDETRDVRLQLTLRCNA